MRHFKLCGRNRDNRDKPMQKHQDDGQGFRTDHWKVPSKLEASGRVYRRQVAYDYLEPLRRQHSHCRNILHLPEY